MPRGTQASFVDALQGLATDIMSLAGAPDADVDFLLQLRGAVLGRLQAGAAQGQQPGAGAPSAGGAPGGAPPMGGGGTPDMGMAAPPSGPPPGPGGEGLSRGPTPAPDLGGATAELQRILAGS